MPGSFSPTSPVGVIFKAKARVGLEVDMLWFIISTIVIPEKIVIHGTALCSQVISWFEIPLSSLSIQIYLPYVLVTTVINKST